MPDMVCDILEENVLESKIITAVIVFVLSLTIVISGAKFHIEVYYDDETYTGQATMYYARNNQIFDEKRSIYTFVDNKKAVFDYDKKYDRLFIVPNREKDTQVHIKAIKLKLDNIPVYTVSGDKLNDWAYTNKEENTAVYENGMLTLASTDQNPYPRLVFADDFIDKIKNTENNSEIYSIALALVYTILFLLALNAVEWLVGKNPKINVFLKKYITRLAFNAVLLVLLFASLRCFNGYMLAVDYENDLIGNDSTVYYDYDDNGFKEMNSAYTKINSLTGENPFFTASEVEGLRIIPNRAADKTARIKSIRVFHEGLQIKKYLPEEIKEKYLKNGEDYDIKDGCIEIKTTSKQESYPILEFDQRFLNELNRSSPAVFALDIAKCAGYFCFVQLCLLLYKKGKKDKQKYLSKVKDGVITFVFTVVSVLFAALEIKALVYIAMPLMLLFGMYALGASDKLQMKKITVYAPVCTVLSAALLFNINSGLFAAQKHFAFAFWCCILLSLSALCYVYTMLRLEGAYTENISAHAENTAGLFIKIFISVFIDGLPFVCLYLRNDARRCYTA